MLEALLARELPRVRADEAPDSARMASRTVDYHRTWARNLRQVENGLARGRGRFILNVLDRDGDGWILLARGGGKSMGLALLEYSPLRLSAGTVIGYGSGC